MSATNIAQTDAENRRDKASMTRRLVPALTTFSLAVGVLIMLIPVLISPVNSDERYQYLLVPGRAKGSWLELVRWSWEEIPFRASQGRVTPLGFLVQRLFYNGVTETSVATGIPIVILHGAVKVILLLAGLACIVAFTRSLRGRDKSGHLAQPRWVTTGLVAALIVVMAAVGAQAHYEGRNGWTVFPVLTYGAVVAGFGTVALVLWLSRKVAASSNKTVPIVAGAIMLMCGIVLNLTYELYYVAFPAALLALFIVPITSRAESRRGRIAKLATGGALTVGFLVTFVTIRIHINTICAQRECYTGVKPGFGTDAIRTAAYNFAGAVPGPGRWRALEEMRQAGVADLPGPFSTPLVIACFAAGAALVAVRILHGERLGRFEQTESASRDGESAALVRGALVALALCLGSAAIMALSVQAQAEITGPFFPYRNTVLTWVALCTAGALALLALDLRLRRRHALTLWVSAGLSVVLVGGVLLPVNLMESRSNIATASALTSHAILRELTLGDPSEAGAQRRCEALVELRNSPAAQRARTAIEVNAQLAYRYFHGVDFCTIPAASGLETTAAE